jgi:hypothetical protein
MTSVHAWFSSQLAIRRGSFVYRKPCGLTVNVTRTSADKDAHRHDEKYVGEVISEADGGCVGPRTRVRGISD